MTYCINFDVDPADNDLVVIAAVVRKHQGWVHHYRQRGLAGGRPYYELIFPDLDRLRAAAAIILTLSPEEIDRLAARVIPWPV